MIVISSSAGSANHFVRCFIECSTHPDIWYAWAVCMCIQSRDEYVSMSIISCWTGIMTRYKSMLFVFFFVSFHFRYQSRFTVVHFSALNQSTKYWRRLLRIAKQIHVNIANIFSSNRIKSQRANDKEQVINTHSHCIAQQSAGVNV